MTPAAQLSFSTLEKIQQRFRLTETGSPFLTLNNRMSPTPVGAMRLFSGPLISKLVYIGLSVPAIRLDSHMLFAFTAADSAVPHFILDTVGPGAGYAFHLDLIPRVDLAVNPAYLSTVYQPLSTELERVRRIQGLSAAPLAPRQHALMSPWTMVYRATETAFAQISETVDCYLNHWISLMELGVTAGITLGGDAASLAERDRLYRTALFNPEVDPVWLQMEQLTNAETAARMQQVLTSQTVET